MKILFPLLIALQFLTKLPITLPRIPTPKENACSVLYYPVIGLMIGAILWSVAVYLPIGVFAKSALLTVLWLWLTGGLHLDGLADTVDGFVGGYGDKARTLEIMKDPHIGAMGVMAITGAILLKFAFLLETLNSQNFGVLLLSPILGRVVILFLFLTTVYIRKNGLGSALSEHLPKKSSILILTLSLFSVLILPINMAIIFVISFFVIGFYLKSWFEKHIGGITGDTIGASVEIMEICLLGMGLLAMRF